MDCKDLQIYGSAYIDNMLSEEEESDFKNHIEECTACNVVFENLKTVVESVGMLEEVELPVNFSDELHEKLQNAENRKSKSILFNKGKMLGSIAATLLIFVFTLSLANNFLNCKKEADFYSGINDVTQEESINIDNASNKAKDKNSDEIGVKEPIMALKMAPVDKSDATEDEINENASKRTQDDVIENYEGENYKDIGLAGGSDSDEKSTINKSIQSLSNDKNFNKVFSSILILALTAGIVILIYKIIKR